VNQSSGQSTAGKALAASGVVMIVIGIVLAIAVSPWGGIVAIVGVFDVIVGQAMSRGMLGGGPGGGTGV
jgi:hypothetical protein